MLHASGRFHDVGDIRLDDVEDPKIQEPTDAIIRLTSSAICGTDLHMIRGTRAGMQPGTGAFDPTEILTPTEPITGAIEAYEVFDQRQPGWIKVKLDPAA